MRTACLLCIQAYRKVVSPYMGRACRFEPTCSQYALDAIRHYGLCRGAVLAVIRLLKCHPFHPGGEDPVQ